MLQWAGTEVETKVGTVVNIVMRTLIAAAAKTGNMQVVHSITGNSLVEF